MQEYLANLWAQTKKLLQRKAANVAASTCDEDVSALKGTGQRDVRAAWPSSTSTFIRAGRRQQAEPRQTLADEHFEHQRPEECTEALPGTQIRMICLCRAAIGAGLSFHFHTVAIRISRPEDLQASAPWRAGLTAVYKLTPQVPAPRISDSPSDASFRKPTAILRLADTGSAILRAAQRQILGPRRA